MTTNKDILHNILCSLTEYAVEAFGEYKADIDDLFKEGRACGFYEIFFAIRYGVSAAVSSYDHKACALGISEAELFYNCSDFINADEDTFISIVRLVLGNAEDAKLGYKRGDKFSEGRSLAYYEALDTIKNRLLVYNYDLKKCGLDINLEKHFP